LGLGLAFMSSSMRHAGEGFKPPAKADLAELVPPGAHALGSATAPLTIVEFADLGCPTCQKRSPEVKAYVRTHPGKIRLVFRNYPIASLHPESMSAAAIAECAAD